MADSVLSVSQLYLAKAQELVSRSAVAAQGDFAKLLQTKISSASEESSSEVSSASGSASQLLSVLSGISSGSSSFLYSGSDALEAIFQKASETYNVPVNLLKAVAKEESNFTADAVSSAGAQGIMQLMPRTAAALGVTNAFDPEQNIMGGAKYISQMLEKYDGNIKLALAAYSAGSGSVDKYGGVPPFKETQNAIKKITEYLAQSVELTGKNVYSNSNISALTALANLLGTSDTSALASLLGTSDTSAIASILGTSDTSALASLLGTSDTSAIASILGTSGTSSLASLLGTSDTSALASLLGTSDTSKMSSMVQLGMENSIMNMQLNMLGD